MSHAIRGNADMGYAPGQADTRRPAIDGGIGGRGVTATRRADTRRPGLNDVSAPGGRGVQAHRGPNLQVPSMNTGGASGAKGVSAQKAAGGVPFIANKDTGGQGVATQRVHKRAGGCLEAPGAEPLFFLRPWLSLSPKADPAAAYSGLPP